MESNRKKLFADSAWYSIVHVISAILLIFGTCALAAFFGIVVIYLIFLSSVYIGGWWIFLMALYISLICVITVAFLSVRQQRELRFQAGDELYFITHGATLKTELLLTRVKRLMHFSKREKDPYELFLERCAEQRRKQRARS